MSKILFGVLLVFSCVPGNASYNYYRALTIDHTKVPNTDQTDFPVLVSLTDVTLRVTGSGGHVQNSNGFDIGFFSDSGLTTPLFWEIERYTGSTGEVIAWVNVSSVSHTADTVFYLGYGDAGISTFQSTASSVWNSNYKGVWHLPDGTTLTAVDSTVNANNGTISSATAVAGEVDGAGSFNGTTANIDVNSSASLNITGNSLTVEAWVKRSTSSAVGSVFDNGVSGVGGVAFAIGVMPATVNQMKLTKYGVVDVVISGIPADTNWHHLVSTWASVTTLYIDGVAQVADGNNQSITSNGDAHACIGCDTVNGTYFAGNIDEVRVSNVVRSADWIGAEYNNHSSPSTFLTLGPELTITPRRRIIN